VTGHRKGGRRDPVRGGTATGVGPGKGSVTRCDRPGQSAPHPWPRFGFIRATWSGAGTASWSTPPCSLSRPDADFCSRDSHRPPGGDGRSLGLFPSGNRDAIRGQVVVAHRAAIAGPQPSLSPAGPADAPDGWSSLNGRSFRLWLKQESKRCGGPCPLARSADCGREVVVGRWVCRHEPRVPSPDCHTVLHDPGNVANRPGTGWATPR